MTDWESVDPRYRLVARAYLTELQFEVLRLRVDGHSWEQIAAVLHRHPSTVRGHHRAAIRRLRIVLRNPDLVSAAQT